MNSKTRQIAGWVALAAVGIALVVLVATMVGPARLLYQRPAGRGTEGFVNDVYVINPTRDVTTVGVQSANLNLDPTVTKVGPGVAATIEHTPADSGMNKGVWQLTAEETSPTPVLLNGARPEGVVELADGDVLSIGGAEVTFEMGRTGFAGALDWWEIGKISHLYASPKILTEAFPIVLHAFPKSLVAVIIAFMLAIPGGLMLAFMKMAKAPIFRWPATLYVDVVRGTPIFLQILLVFFALPLMPFWQTLVRAIPAIQQAGLLGETNSMWFRVFMVLSLNSAAYMAEIFRAGIQSISKGQMEAARSLGMTTAAAMTYVIIPQTVRRILPTMMSEFILLFKDTALFSAVGFGEMVLRAREVASTTLNTSPYIIAAGFYLLITIPLGRLVQQMENRLARSEGGGSATFEKSVEDNMAALAAKKAAAEAAAARAAEIEARTR